MTVGGNLAHELHGIHQQDAEDGYTADQIKAENPFRFSDRAAAGPISASLWLIVSH